MKNQQFLEDLQAYIMSVNVNAKLDVTEKYNRIVSTLLHDLNGVINDEPLFLPRVDGYANTHYPQI
jgi:hypothetical protein